MSQSHRRATPANTVRCATCPANLRVASNCWPKSRLRNQSTCARRMISNGIRTLPIHMSVYFCLRSFMNGKGAATGTGPLHVATPRFCPCLHLRSPASAARHSGHRAHWPCASLIRLPVGSGGCCVRTFQKVHTSTYQACTNVWPLLSQFGIPSLILP